MNPQDRKYSKEHEWAKEGSNARIDIGITDFAQDQLGDIVYVDLPDVGSSIIQFEKFGEVESVKAVSDLFSPVSGEVIEVNQEVIDHPELVNDDPLEKGWLLAVKSDSSAQDMGNLLTAEQYDNFLESEAH